MAAWQVDDRKAPVAQAELALEMEAFVVRTAMRHGTRGARECRRVRRGPGSEVELTCDATHQESVGEFSSRRKQEAESSLNMHGGRLARRPVEDAPAEQVKMDVEYRLACAGAIIDHGAVSARLDSTIAGKTVGHV